MSTEVQYEDMNPAGLHEVQQVLPALDAAAEALLARLQYPTTGNPSDIWLNIAATASAAGSVALRGTVPEIEQYTAGEFVLSDVHDAQGRLWTFMAAVAPFLGLSAGIENVVSPGRTSPEVEVSELVGRVQGALRQITADASMAPKFRGYVAALASMKLVAGAHSTGVLDQKTGKGVAASYLVAGSKTVPPSMHLNDTQSGDHGA
jgi:hypothetical protein